MYSWIRERLISKRPCGVSPTRPWLYEWERESPDLPAPRQTCSNACWMSDDAWTAWKNSTETLFDSEPQLSDYPQLAEFKSKTLSTRLLFACVLRLTATSTQARKNVRRLRISKSLTCAELREQLTERPVSAMRHRNSSSSAITGCRQSGKTSSLTYVYSSGKTLWTAENSDPIQDMRDWTARMKEEQQ